MPNPAVMSKTGSQVATVDAQRDVSAWRIFSFVLATALVALTLSGLLVLTLAAR
jgi:hypothetical protein